MPGIPFFGEITALSVSFFLALGAYYIGESVGRIGSFNVNALRIIIYVWSVFIIYLLIFKSPLPSANYKQWFFLSLSAICGLIIGDGLFFLSLRYISTGLTVMVSSPAAPIFTVIIGFFLLHESLSLFDVLGIVITLSGLYLVLAGEKESIKVETGIRDRIIGVALSVLSAAGQGASLVLVKFGMISTVYDTDKPLDPFSVTYIRILMGGLIIWLYVLLRGRSVTVFRSVKTRTDFKYIFLAAISWVVAIWLSIVSVNYIKTGITSALMSMMPIMIIPILYFLKREKVGMRKIVGSFISFTGVLVLLLT